MRRKGRSWLVAQLKVAFKMDPLDAAATADTVLQHFNGGDEVDDMPLTADVRALFYELQGRKILLIRRFEFEDENGRTLRGYRWRFNGSLQPVAASAPVVVEEHAVYAELPASVWQRARGQT